MLPHASLVSVRNLTLRAISVILSCLLFFCAVPQAQASTPKLPVAPIWTGCAQSAKEEKRVRDFGNGHTLNCGNNSRGYRHIVGRHKNDFAENAATFLTARTWRDLADFVMLWTIDDADRVRPAGGGKFCHDRYFYLANSHGRVVLTQRFIVITNAQQQIITAYPSGKSRC